MVVIAVVAIVLAFIVGLFIGLFLGVMDDEENDSEPHDLSQRRKDAENLPISASEPGIFELHIPASGQEVFTPRLDAGVLHELRVVGSYSYSHFQYKHQHFARADAAFFTDEKGNFSRRYQGLKIGGVAVEGIAGWHEDRAEHEYTLCLDGSGEHLSLLLRPPLGGRSREFLTLCGKRLPDELSLAARSAAEQAQRLHEAEQARMAQIEAQKRYRIETLEFERAQRLRPQITALKLRVERERNFLDAEFRRHFVARHWQRLLSDLRPKIQAEYDQVMANEELVTALTRERPEVLRWFECRLDLLLAAERLEIMPQKEPVLFCGPVRVNPANAQEVEGIIGELAALRREYHTRRSQAALSGSPCVDCSDLAHASAFHLAELERYGIRATTPEEARDKLSALLPAPVVPARRPDLYEELRRRLEVGERAAADAVMERLEDLHREKIILSARRRALVRSVAVEGRGELDLRLEAVRRESALLKAALEAHGHPVVFKDFRETREESREQKFMELHSEKKRILDALASEGDGEGAEQVEALYAEEQAKLFQTASDGNYT